MTPITSNDNDKHKALLLHLLTMLSMSAMQELGKLKNQLTGKVEVHLDMAQATIDMLDMLEAKTRGNRDADEEKALKDTLTMLKMNYVETKEQQRSEPQNSEVSDQEDKGTEEQGDTKTSEPTAIHPTADSKQETKDPKFRKTYS